jgi:hypothetical protein
MSVIMPRTTRPLRRQPSRCAVWVVAFAALWGARAMADTPLECAQAYERAQVERKMGLITAAIESLTICAGQNCPNFIRKDCIDWLTESQTAQPSVVFSVRRNGADLTDVEIACDGRIVTRVLDGKAVLLDPGSYRFAFRVPGARSIEKQIVIREGERNRIVEIDLDREAPTGAVPPLGDASHDLSSPASANPDAASSAAGGTLLPYAFTGIGVLGVSGFVAFGLWGNSQKADLERSCSPFCRASQVDAVRTKYIVADTALALGLVSLGLATYWFLSSHETARASDQVTSVAVAPMAAGRGGVVQVVTSF